MLYPFKFDPIYKEILWGGRRIGEYFDREIQGENIAESWELSCRDDGMSVISNGEHRGTELSKLICQYKEQILGTKIYEKYGLYFPLLVKIIDANDKLSVQVHPDDEYAKLIGENNGKNEMWYILDAKDGAKLIYGLKQNISRKDFVNAIKNGTVSDTLNEVHVKAGDCLYIPSGTVHAILEDILIAEIQQNSNTTFRIFDWDRTDKHGNKRELHIEKALDIINFDTNELEKNVKFKENCNLTDNIKLDDNVTSKEEIKLIESEYFSVDEININDKYVSTVSKDAFMIIMNIYGFGKIHWENGSEIINKGDTLLLPACLGKFEIEGSLKLLSVYAI